MFRWDNLGVLGLVCRLYSEREENEKNDVKRQELDTVEIVEVEDDNRERDLDKDMDNNMRGGWRMTRMAISWRRSWNTTLRTTT